MTQVASLERLAAAQRMCWYHRMELLAILGVFLFVPSLAAQVSIVKAMLGLLSGVLHLNTDSPILPEMEGLY